MANKKRQQRKINRKLEKMQFQLDCANSTIFFQKEEIKKLKETKQNLHKFLEEKAFEECQLFIKQTFLQKLTKWFTQSI